jgi:hypothetical protein
MTPATRLISHLRASVLCIDDSWAQDIPGGYAWWPHQQRQGIFIDRQRQEGGMRLERVVVTTDVCTLHDPESTKAPLVLGLTELTTLSGLVWEDGLLRLHAHAWVDQSNLPLYDMILTVVAGLQIHEASVMAQVLQDAGLGIMAHTAHPLSGFRGTPDEMTTVVETLMAPLGQNEPPWPEEMLDDLRETYMDHPPCLMANSDPTGLTAEFPFGLESSLVRVVMDQEHPIIGRGLAILNSFNVEEVNDPLVDDPVTMNAREIDQSDAPFFGSWTASENDTMNFRCFVPNVLTNPAAASNMIILACARSRRMSMQWMDDDWSQTWDAEGNCRAKTAVERIMGRFSEE